MRLTSPLPAAPLPAHPKPTAVQPRPEAFPWHPFCFIRHGQTDWNVAKRVQGHTDVPLNATGVLEAQQAAAALAEMAFPLPLGMIISSPLQRAAVTAATIQQKLGVPLHHDARLRERGYGSFEGLLRSEIMAKFGRAPHEDYHDLLPPDSEPPAQVHARIMAVVGTHTRAAQARETLPLFVGHGAFMAHLTGLLGLDPERRFANAQPYLFTPTGRGWRLEALPLPPLHAASSA